MPLKLQIVSDLHTEFYSDRDRFNFLKPSADYLVLLGDIGCVANDFDFIRYKKFILECLTQYKRIYIITGNHEYYFNASSDCKEAKIGNTIQACNEKIKLFCAEYPTKLKFLNNSSSKIIAGKQTYLLVGTTLWSNLSVGNPEFIQSNMNDYKHIHVQHGNKIRKLTSADVMQMHLTCLRYIKSQLVKSKKKGYSMILLTHHKPYIGKSFDPTSLDPAYESDCSSVIIPPMCLAAYGHTHRIDQCTINGVKIYSMPKGYPKQKTMFKRDAYVVV